MSYNEKSKENLIPFQKGEDPRRMRGRRKGSFNQTSIIKQMLGENITPEMLFSPTTRNRFKNVKGKTYMAAITATLINQSLEGDTQASNILLRELRKFEDNEPRGIFSENPPRIEIVTVNSKEEVDRLNKVERRLKSKYGENYEELLD